MTTENELNPSMSSTELSLEELKRILEYNPKTGLFTRKIDVNNCMARTIAGTERNDGYIYICINNVRVLAHRLAWFYVYGEWPKGHVDHINQMKPDNRILNLREASHAQNNINRPAQINNILGIKGIKRHGNKYIARLNHNKVPYYLGLFDTLEEAIDARRQKEIEFYGEYSEGKS